jgi:hypothetical protein
MNIKDMVKGNKTVKFKFYRFSAKDPALLVRGWIAGTLEAF